MNEVDSLLKKPFSNLKYEDKLEIIRLGPKQPRDHRISQHDGNKRRLFRLEWFDKKPWLTVSESKSALFCFYCLLFGGENMWTVNGFKDLKHLSDRVKNHECSNIHLNNAVQFNMFGKNNTNSTAIDNGYRLGIKKHNELVDKNRHALSRIIDCLKFCGFHELPLRNNHETELTDNPGYFLDMVSYTLALDSVLSAVLKDSATKMTSASVQYDLLDCIHKVYLEEIKSEIEEVNFASVQVTENLDGCGSQLAIIVRYVKESQPVERLISFVDISARSLMSVLIDELWPFDLWKKLVAHSYDWGSTIGASPEGVDMKMKEFYPYAHYVHCYAHELDTIIKKVCSSHERIKIFFSNLSGFGEFFKISKRRNLFQVVCAALKGNVYETQWNSYSSIVSYVFENRKELLECFDRIQSTENWDDISICESVGLKRTLEDLEFDYLLSFFYPVFHQVFILQEALQASKPTDIITIEQALKNFESSMKQIEISDLRIFQKPSEVDNTESPSVPMSPNIETLAASVNDVHKKIIKVIYDRFYNFEMFRSFAVVDPRMFKLHKKKFPFDQVHIIKNNYEMLAKDKLISELTVLYENKNFSNISNFNALSRLLNDHKLLDAFSETSKLTEIVLVTPTPTEDAERCFKTLNKVKSFLENSRDQDGLNALAVLSIHKDFIKDISQFNKKVIEKFANMKNGREEFLYKTLNKHEREKEPGPSSSKKLKLSNKDGSPGGVPVPVPLLNSKGNSKVNSKILKSSGKKEREPIQKQKVELEEVYIKEEVFSPTVTPNPGIQEIDSLKMEVIDEEITDESFSLKQTSSGTSEQLL